MADIESQVSQEEEVCGESKGNVVEAERNNVSQEEEVCGENKVNVMEAERNDVNDGVEMEEVRITISCWLVYRTYMYMYIATVESQ